MESSLIKAGVDVSAVSGVYSFTISPSTKTMICGVESTICEYFAASASKPLTSCVYK